MAIKDDTLINVRNRNNGTTSYVIPDRNIHRDWAPGETKKIPFDELRAFSYTPGGEYALKHLLVVEDKEAISMLLNEEVEPEYNYTEADITNILFNGSIDAFADFLDFAPDGAIEIAKTIAIEKEIPDIRKRNMLSEKTGLNINNAIMVNTIMNAEDEPKTAESGKQRRVPIENTKATDDAEPKRRVPQQYKVVETK